MTPAQIKGAKTSYAKTLTVLGLSGALLGALIGQYVSEPATMSKTLFGTIIGGGVTLVGYGAYLRTGGPDIWRNPMVPEEATTMAGLLMV